MTSFPKFLSTLDPDAGERGKQFEHFVKWFLKNDPEWETQVEEVWLWNDYPGQWGRDKGIDLVFKDKSGKIWAVQAKCYSPNYEITKADVDKFLSEIKPETDRPPASHCDDGWSWGKCEGSSGGPRKACCSVSPKSF